MGESDRIAPGIFDAREGPGCEESPAELESYMWESYSEVFDMNSSNSSSAAAGAAGATTSNCSMDVVKSSSTVVAGFFSCRLFALRVASSDMRTSSSAPVSWGGRCSAS